MELKRIKALRSGIPIQGRNLTRAEIKSLRVALNDDGLVIPSRVYARQFTAVPWAASLYQPAKQGGSDLISGIIALH